MANIDVDTALSDMRSALESAGGTSRTIPSSRFDGGMYLDLPDGEKSRRALVKPRVETRVVSMERPPESPAAPCNFAIYKLTCDVVVIRHLNADHKLTDSDREDARALAFTDASFIRQAFEFPGNLTTWVSQKVRWLRSDLSRFQLGENEPGLIETTHRFEGYLSEDPDA